MKPELPDERLHALIDGELTPADAESLLARLREDASLRERACELRHTKELVRHAYARMDPAPRARDAARTPLSWGAAVAVGVFAAGLLVGWFGRDGANGLVPQALDLTERSTAVAARETDRIVLHVGSGAQEKARAVLDRAEGILDAAQASGRPVAVEIVANGSGLDLLRDDVSAHKARIASLRARYPSLALVACGQTAQRLREAGVDVRLVPGTTVASSALDEIVRRMQEGWSYVLI